jgi:hypothetical protein
MSGELRADPDAITKYAGDMLKWGIHQAAQTPMPLTQMSPLASEAFLGISDAGQFQEAKMMLAAVESSTSQFKAFLGDVTTGIQAMANAAQVCADAYRGNDAESAANIDIVRFAFGDPEAHRPAGLDKSVTGKTLADQRMEDAATGTGGMVDALTNPDGGRTETPASGTVVTVYPDGSRRAISTWTVGGESQTITSISDAKGTVLSKSTEKTVTNADGSTTHSLADDTNPHNQTVTSTTTDPAGKKTIVTTQNGKPVGKPITVEPDSAPAVVDPKGPVEQAVDEYGHKAGVYDYGDAKEPDMQATN